MFELKLLPAIPGISPTNITFIEVTFKQDGRFNHKAFTIEWDNEYKINRINGFSR